MSREEEPLLGRWPELHNTESDLDDLPDGGLVAWTQVFMGHLVIFNSWGYITS